MLFGNRRPRKSDARRRDAGLPSPVGEALEAGILLTIDLGGTSPPANPIIATAPFGIGLRQLHLGGGAGCSVADFGDVNGMATTTS